MAGDTTLSSLQGTQLFARTINLTIGFFDSTSTPVTAKFNTDNSKGVQVDGLDIEFTVDKSLKPTEPNTCAIRVYNFQESTRQKLSGSSKLSVRLEAGYKGGNSQIYFSEARAAWTTREGANYITHIESTDTIARPTGIRKTKKIQPGSVTGSLYRTLGPKVPLADAFRTIAQNLGIGEGNLKAALANISGTPLNSVNGGALIGNGARVMTDLCRSAGLEWSVQDGNLQLINIGQTLSSTKAILVSTNTGLVESPSVDSQGALTVQTLLIPGLAPGVLVKMDSLFVSGGYRVEKCRYTGSTFTGDWHCHFDAIKY